MGKLKEDWKLASKKGKIHFMTSVVFTLFCGGIGIYFALLFANSHSVGQTNWLYCLGAIIMCLSLVLLSRIKGGEFWVK